MGRGEGRGGEGMGVDKVVFYVMVDLALSWQLETEAKKGDNE